MYHYLIAPLGVKSPPLTYICEESCEISDVCTIVVRGKPYQGIVLKAQEKPEFECEYAHKTQIRFLPHQQILATFIAQYYCASFGESYGLFTPSTAENITLKKLTFTPTHRLSDKQLEALTFCKTHNNPLLFGDTGSGKTEIYIQLIIETLSQGKNALFLMPEIALTPQIESRLKAVFGDAVAIWHSKISAKNKTHILQDLQEGHIRVIAGARSALFLPILHLGLIIVDEEHDDAYKSQSAPRYNARDLALYAGQKMNIKVILGSATPSVTSYHHAHKQGNVYRLKGRHFHSKKHISFIPPMIDGDILHQTLIDKIALNTQKKQQSIIFLPTRAHYKMLVCSVCGSGVECDFCSVNMSLHLDRNALICHYCHFAKAIPALCPSCHNDTLRTYRVGTAQIAQILSDALPSTRIALFDRDNITTHNKLKKILQSFNNGDIDVLVGTQMLSKGHDYHSVNLAIILGIDFILKSSDYRCNERAIALLHQIAGRSGRKYDGEVYIESANADFLRRFIDDYEQFLHYELSHRPTLYPPFKRIATLTFAHKKEQKAKESLTKVRKILEQSTFSNIEVVGDGKARLGRLYDKYRFMLLLRSDSIRALLSALHYIKNDNKLSTLCEIDIDPLNIV